MKKILAIVLALTVLLGCCACGKSEPTIEAAPAPTAAETEATTEATEPAVVLENDNVTVEGIYVDTAYVDSSNPDVKLVYVFVNLHPTTADTKADSKYSQLTIDGAVYESDFYKNYTKYMPNYYYSSFIEDVPVGTELKVVLTFKIPESMLANGEMEVTLSDSSMPFAGLHCKVDTFVFCDNVEQVAEQADPDGYAQEAAMRQPADDATVQQVRNSINGYYFSFYVSAGTQILKYELEFYAPNKFEVRTPLMTNSGTYEVYNGYIYLTYPTGGSVVEIAYEFNNGEIALYCDKAFSIYE